MADFAVVTEPFELPAGLAFHVLRKIQEVPVCSSAFSLSTGTLLVKEQMKQYPMIGLGEKTSSFAFYSEFFNKMGLSFAPEVEAATADQILPMIRSDLGICFVPTDFLEKENMENLIILNMRPSVPERNICIVKRKDTSLSIAAAELERLLRKTQTQETLGTNSLCAKDVRRNGEKNDAAAIKIRDNGGGNGNDYRGGK